MRVGLVVPGFSADAQDWCIPALRHLARSLAAHGDDVRVIAIRYPYRASRYTLEGVDVIALGGAERRGGQVLGVWRKTLDVLRAEHRRRPFDVLHAFWATESGMLTAIAGKLLRIPTVVSLAGGELVGLPEIGYGDQRVAWERLKIRASLGLASAVTAGSEYLLTLAAAHVRRPQSRLYRAPLGVDLDLFKPAARAQPAHPPPRLVHVATLTRIKDQTTLLHAFALLRHRLASEPGLAGAGLSAAGPSAAGLMDAGLAGTGVDEAGLAGAWLCNAGRAGAARADAKPADAGLNDAGLADASLAGAGLARAGATGAALVGATLDIVGNGPMRDALEQLAWDLGIASAVRFWGNVDHAALPDVYRDGTAFVLSSRHEAQGMVAIEAAACGIPLVGTRVGVVPELAASADAVVPIGAAEALADALFATCTRADSHTRAQRAQEHARSEFGLEPCTARFRALYAQVAGTRDSA